MKLIVFNNDNGGLSITYPTEESLGAMSIDEVADLVVPDGISFHIIEQEKIPPNRDFRNAWKYDNSVESVNVNMQKARDIHRDRIRIKRDEKLKALDISYMRADEQGDATQKANIANEKQILRDLPQDFDLTQATTPEELNALWPSVIER